MIVVADMCASRGFGSLRSLNQRVLGDRLSVAPRRERSDRSRNLVTSECPAPWLRTFSTYRVSARCARSTTEVGETDSRSEGRRESHLTAGSRLLTVGEQWFTGEGEPLFTGCACVARNYTRLDPILRGNHIPIVGRPIDHTRASRSHLGGHRDPQCVRDIRLASADADHPARR